MRDVLLLLLGGTRISSPPHLRTQPGIAQQQDHRPHPHAIAAELVAGLQELPDVALAEWRDLSAIHLRQLHGLGVMDNSGSENSL